MTSRDTNALSGMTVQQAMRKHFTSLPTTAPISNAISTLIKHKVNGLLTTDEHDNPVGVLSKTDIVGAYYADLPLDEEIYNIMSRPPLFCALDDLLENALEIMRENGVYRLYVKSRENDKTVGVLAYPDIVGLLYKHCFYCEYSNLRRTGSNTVNINNHLRVQEVMVSEISAIADTSTLLQVIEELSMNRIGALLLLDSNNSPSGVISKTDLILAYKHSMATSEPAHTIMTSPVRCCKVTDLLEDVIRQLIVSGLHRFFVSSDTTADIIGLLSLSDAARNRSGSCHACISSRIEVGK